MLEGYLASVLNRYVGEYLEDLNTDQLSIALLSGQVELENVPFKTTALSKFDVPVDVKSGVVGKLCVKIPITAIRSEPWVVKLNDVFILLGSSVRQFLGKEEEEAEAKRKEQLLKELEDTHKKILLKKAKLLTSENEEQNQWWGTSMISSIINNIQLIITNVHIRYEDNKTISQDTVFSFGLKIKSINIYTTNEEWKMGYITRNNTDYSYKKLNIDGASIYWNANEKQFSNIGELGTLKNAFFNQNFYEDCNVIKPFGLQIRVTKNTSKLHLISEKNPRFKFDVLPKKLYIDITVSQLIQMRALANEWKRFDRAKKYRKWRPKKKISESCNLWWKFAIDRIIDSIRRKNLRNTWEYAISNAKLINNYSSVYRKRLILYLKDEVKKHKKCEIFRNFSIFEEFSDFVECKKETFYIKQIERDNQIAYSTLSLTRDYVCKKLMNKIESYVVLQQHYINNTSIDRGFGISKSDMVTDTSLRKNHEELIRKESSSNLYNWFASWFPKGEKDIDEFIIKKDNRPLDTDVEFSIFKSHELPANFRKVEKKMEEDLFEALNEMWDDSAIFIRDKILAVLSLKMESIIVRILIDNCKQNECNCISIDLSKVSTDIQLSAREHRMTILLGVGDFNVQCTKVTVQQHDQIPSCNISNSIHNVFDDTFLNSSAQIIFTIGKSKVSVEGYNHIENSFPIISMSYSRFSPKTTVFHEFNAKFVPLSIVFDESSVDNFLAIFNLYDNDNNNKNFCDYQNEEIIYNQENHLYCCIKIPIIDVILKTRRNSLFSQNINVGNSEIFATIAFDGINFAISKTEEHLTKYKIGIKSLCVRDFYEQKFSKILEIRNYHNQVFTRNRSNSFPGSILTLAISKEKCNSVFDVSSKHSEEISNEEFYMEHQIEPSNRFFKFIESDFEISNNDQLIITIIHVQRNHRQFFSKYKEVEFNFDMQVPRLDIGINQLTCILLQDIFDFIPKNPNKNELNFNDDWELQELLLQGLHELNPTFNLKEHKMGTKILAENELSSKIKPNLPLPINVFLSGNVQEIKVFMNLPKSESCLGVIHLDEVKFDAKLGVNVEELPVEIHLTMKSLKVDNSMPIFNSLYQQVLSIEKNESSNINDSFIEIKILKYKNFDLIRPFDIKIDVSIDESFKFAYLHIHKFFCLITDFWMNYVSLIDQMSNKGIIGVNYNEEANLMTRTLLEFNINCSGFVAFPLHQLSSRCIIMKMKEVRVSNKFVLASQSKYMDDYGIDKNIMQDNYDCLFDNIDIFLSELEIFEGERVTKNSKQFSTYENYLDGLNDIIFSSNFKSVLSRKYSTKIIFGRNLSSLISHNSPNMAAVLLFESIDITLTTEFYKLIQGFLQNNLGDCTELDTNFTSLDYQTSSSFYYCKEHLEQYINTSFRMKFLNTNIKLLTPSKSNNCWNDFGIIYCGDAILGCDSYMKYQLEINFIAYFVQFIDTRLDSIDKKSNEAKFSKVLLQKNDVCDSKKKVIGEMHVFIKNDDAPIVTFVLQRAKLLVIPDWFLTLKEFFLLKNYFDLASEEALRNIPKFKDIFKSGKYNLNNETSISTHETKHTLTMKIQLTDTDVVFIENLSDPRSLALICLTTAVLQLNDKMGHLNLEFIMQKIEISWCILAEENETSCVISTPFDIEIKLSTMSNNILSDSIISSLPYSGSSKQNLPKHYIITKIDNCSFRLSYKDSLVIMSVIEGFKKLLEKCFYQIHWVPINKTTVTTFNTISIERITCSLSDFSFWVLNDFNEPTLPVVRLSSVRWKIFYTQRKFISEGILSIEYFNQTLSGWEPFLEPVEVFNFSLEYLEEKSIHSEFRISPESYMDINITTHLLQQFKTFYNEFLHIKETVDINFRNLCGKGRTNNMSYVIKNKLGCDLYFTSEINKLLQKNENYRRSVKWFHVENDNEVMFSLPVDRNHLYDSDCNNYSRLVLAIDGYEELQPINIDTVRIYNINAKKRKNMLKNDDGRRAIVVRTAYSLTNCLNISVILKIDNFINGDKDWKEVKIAAGNDYYIPLTYVYSRIYYRPLFDREITCYLTKSDYLEVIFNEEQYNEEIILPNFTKFTQNDKQLYVILSKVNDEKFFNKIIPGFNVLIYPPLLIRNQLPADIYCEINGQNMFCQTGNMISLENINVDESVVFKFMTDRLKSIEVLEISRNYILKLQNRFSKPIIITMIDEEKRKMNIYADISLSRTGSITIVLWVTYWIVNKSGIPLIIKKHDSFSDAPGQLLEHEQGKDKIPLMLSFNSDDEVQKCNLRIGKAFLPDKDYFPQYSSFFKLAPGEQSLVLHMKHYEKPTLIYNVGIEIRQGTGRYKNTQVVIFSPRYLLINKSSYSICLSHIDDINFKRHIILEPNSNLIWNESFEDNGMICIKRHDIKYWSQPFRIDQVGSYFITMRDYDETPNFVRVETTLSNARFCIIFSNTEFYPPPIQIINDSPIPILYQQFSRNALPNHLKSICKAYTKIDYAWDFLYGQKLLSLQVSNNSSHSYDPTKPTIGPSLYYENYSFIFLESSISGLIKSNTYNNLMDGLVLTVVDDSNHIKLMPIKKGGTDLKQLWNFTSEGVIESVGLTNFESNSSNNYVLDLHSTGREYILVVSSREKAKNKTQIWKFDEEGRFSCEFLDGYLMKSIQNYLTIGFHNNINVTNYIFKRMYQKEGNGILNVQCSHIGPTFIVRVSFPNAIQLKESSTLNNHKHKCEINILISNSIGFSLINAAHEELLYGRLKGVYLNLTKNSSSYMCTFNVHSIQIDNQLNGVQKFSFFFCEASEEKERLARLNDTYTLPQDQEIMFCLASPAMKIELNYTSKEHYDSFECFKILFSNIYVNLDEQLLWKFIEFIQESGTAESVMQISLLQPPNIDLDNVDNISMRRCYFGNLSLNIGNISLSVTTIPTNAMSKKLQKIKQNFNIHLMSFENASITLPPFVQTHTFETISFLVECLKKFYINELYTQTFNIIVSLDAFGNPLGLVTDIKDSFQTLIFEGNVSGFVSGFSYGVANSFSKVMSSMATGVGALITDKDYELKRRRAIKIDECSNDKNPLTHLYHGFKGLGTGVIGGATAIVGNTMKETRNKGLFVGLVKGVGTGVVDTVTKPVQGVFDFIGGTATAMKEVAGNGHIKKQYIRTERLRLLRVCTSLYGLLQPYKIEYALAQQLILTNFSNISSNSVLLEIEIYHEQKIKGEFVQLCALICTDKTYFLQKNNGKYTEIINILDFKSLITNSLLFPKKLEKHDKSGNYLAIVASLYDVKSEKTNIIEIIVYSYERAQILCDKLNRAKELYDRASKTI